MEKAASTQDEHTIESGEDEASHPSLLPHHGVYGSPTTAVWLRRFFDGEPSLPKPASDPVHRGTREISRLTSVALRATRGGNPLWTPPEARAPESRGSESNIMGATPPESRRTRTDRTGRPRRGRRSARPADERETNRPAARGTYLRTPADLRVQLAQGHRADRDT